MKTTDSDGNIIFDDYLYSSTFVHANSFAHVSGMDEVGRGWGGAWRGGILS